MKWLAIVALALSGCAHSGGGNGLRASASYTNLSAVLGAFSLSAPAPAVVKSKHCSLASAERTAVLAALARVEPEKDPYDGDTEVFTGPDARSGLLIAFRNRAGPAMTVMLQGEPPRADQMRVLIRVNGRLGSIAPESLMQIQAAAVRSGCRIAAHRGSAA